jgi:hypothetical protein
MIRFKWAKVVFMSMAMAMFYFPASADDQCEKGPYPYSKVWSNWNHLAHKTWPKGKDSYPSEVRVLLKNMRR